MRSLILTTVILAACAQTPAKPAAAPVPAPTTTTATATAMPTSIVWSRASAEHRAAYLQTYRLAAQQLETQVATLPRGSWAVILDADETVLDNSIYQQERAQLGMGFSSDSWAAWVKRGVAPALPGAATFTARVHELGGLVAIVTNRNEAVCAETRANLEKVAVHADVVLCQQPGQGDKNPRFQAVEQGTAIPDRGALRVIEWLGDNIQDFPSLKQDVRLAGDSALSAFGRTFFLFPNPMYGSWERNPLP